MLDSSVTTGVPSTTCLSARLNHCSARPASAWSAFGISSLWRLNSTSTPYVRGTLRTSQRTSGPDPSRSAGRAEQQGPAGGLVGGRVRRCGEPTLASGIFLEAVVGQQGADAPASGAGGRRTHGLARRRLPGRGGVALVRPVGHPGRADGAAHLWGAVRR